MNKTVLAILGGVGVVALILVGYFVSNYNNLVKLDTAVQTQWAQVETSYQRRYDLIPQLVESVKGAMGQEEKIFTAIAEARTKYGQAGSPSDKAQAAGELESALSRLLVVMENYPDLRSSDRVGDLMVQLEGTENRISVERRRYNETVQQYNLAVRRFPTVIFASIFGFEQKQPFEASEGAENAPRVDFGDE